MPLTFEIHDLLVLTRATGTVTAEDLFEHANSLSKVRDRPPRELVDFIGRREITVPMSAVRQIAEMLRRGDINPPGSKVAMVADSDAAFGVLNVFRAYREDSAVAVEVFRTRAEAASWLGIAELPSGT